MAGIIKMLRALFLLFCLMGTAYAGTVRLINTSPYDLRAVIRGSDGSFLGEVLVKAQRETVWTDTYGQFGTYMGPNAQMDQAWRSQTPYTVLWYCLDGGDYGVCDTVATGGLVLSQGCAGTRQCKARQKEKYPSVPRGDYLQPESTPSQ